MISQKRGWTLMLAALPLCWALSGCGGDKPKPSGSGAKSGSSSGSKSSGTETTSGGGDEKSDTVAPAVAPEGYGTIKGMITYDGDAPEQVLIHKAGADVKDPAVCAKNDLPDE